NRTGDEVTADEMTFAGRWALVRAGGGEARRWALVEGTLLRWGSETLVASDTPVTVGALMTEGGLRVSVECPAAATVTVRCPVKAALVEVTGVNQTTGMAVDEAAGTITISLPGGRCDLSVRGQ
ncbi:MAG: hypothetical protein J7M38_03840, partial [Armatimonadetes bacterium]|nr:hypothetical protein [Armatimonadota bacterium]